MTVTSTSTTSDLVEVVRAIAEVIKALAWPVVTLTIALVFRSYIAAIIGRASGLKWGDLTIEFERQLESAEETAGAIEPSPAADAQPEPGTSDLPPAYIVIEAWGRVERELIRVAQHVGIHSLSSHFQPNITRILAGRQILDSGTVTVINALRSMRNAAAHAKPGDPEITLEQAMRFRELAGLVIGSLQQILERPPPQGEAG